MNVIVVDDEQLILTLETAEIQKELPNENVFPFDNGDDALEYAANSRVDIAFLDINIGEVTGIELAKKLIELNEDINIIFCTGYSEYAMDALDLYCSAYLMKPLTNEKLKKALSQLRHKEKPKTDQVVVQCFGNFEVFYKGVPVKFKYSKAKDMFAYLIDRKGALVSTSEIMVELFQEDDKSSYVRNIKADLTNTFESLGKGDLFLQEWGKIGIDSSKVDCDYYRYLDGEKELFKEEYMSQYQYQYDFADMTLERLMNY